MMRGSVLLAALLFNAPIIWQALIPQTVSVDEAVIRFIITVPVAALLIELVRTATRHHEQSRDELARARQTKLDQQ